MLKPSLTILHLLSRFPLPRFQRPHHDHLTHGSSDLPTRRSKRQLDRFTRSRTTTPLISHWLKWAALYRPPKIAPYRGAISTPIHAVYRSLDPPDPPPQTASKSVQPFLNHALTPTNRQTDTEESVVNDLYQ